MKSFFAAFSFLTTLPVAKFIECDAAAVGRSAGWFPLVGAVLGLFSAAVAFILKNHLPPGVIGVALVALDVLVTGGLHFDGLADTADGFGGGKDRQDVLRIMRDHNIGSFGGLALAIVVALKVTAYAALLVREDWMLALIVTPALSRLAMVVLAATVPYARPSPSAVNTVTTRSLLWGTVAMLAVLGAAAFVGLPAKSLPLAAGAVVLVTMCVGPFFRRRIGGITGDTLGASLELSECAALLAFLWMAHAQ